MPRSTIGFGSSNSTAAGSMPNWPQRSPLPNIDSSMPRTGHRTMSAYLRARLDWSDSEAGRFRGLARAIDHIDGLGDAWHAGQIGVSQAIGFGRLHGNRRVSERLAEFAPMLLEHAEQLPDADFVACIERFTALADADGAYADRDEALEHRDAHVDHVGGMVDITAHGGDGATAAEMIAIHRAGPRRSDPHDPSRRDDHAAGRCPPAHLPGRRSGRRGSTLRTRAPTIRRLVRHVKHGQSTGCSVGRSLPTGPAGEPP